MNKLIDLTNIMNIKTYNLDKSSSLLQIYYNTLGLSLQFAVNFFLKAKIVLMVTLIIFSLILLLSTAKLALADQNVQDVTCSSAYGAQCPQFDLKLDKKVKNPQTGELVDTLSANSHNFLAGQEIFFRIEVKNTGSSQLNNISVSDKLPDHVDFVSGPGSFDRNSRTLTFNLDKLNPGESKIFDVKAQIGKTLPDMGIICLTNFAEAKKDQMIAQDTAGFCIQTKILGAVTQLPITGVSDLGIIFFGSLGMLITSIILFKKFKLN